MQPKTLIYEPYTRVETATLKSHCLVTYVNVTENYPHLRFLIMVRVQFMLLFN